ncbi:unnamed protein product [Discula destructiva]
MSSTAILSTPSDSVDQKQDALRSSLPTDKDFARWRPSYHLIAPRGWMNDPCAPGFVPSTGTYHVGFQWNPNGAEWGDIVWGNAFSKDLVTWDVSEKPSLAADAPYDRAAVFTGCWNPTGVDGRHDARGDSGAVMVAYTSVTRLPIHYTKDYHYGCESLSVATSVDGGKTWTKLDSNPILPGPPEAVDATGWRDPYIARWPAMSKLLARRQNGQAPAGTGEGNDLFGIVSGGIRNKTPTTWLYRIDPSDLTKWSYAGPLVKPGLSFSPSRWTGDLGVNWEVTNFTSLQDHDQQHSQDFLIFGAEGCKAPYGGAGVVPGTTRCNRAQLWVAIDGAADNPQDDALATYTYGGIFDHGLFYAANGFWDPASKQQIVIGWVTEDDLPVEMQIRQGWSGCLSLPRVVALGTIPHVSGASRSAVGDLTCMKAIPEQGRAGLYTVQTLHIMPDPRLQKLRLRASKHEIPELPLGLGNQTQTQMQTQTQTQTHQLPLKSAHWEARGAFSGVGSCKRVGVRIHHPSTSQATVLYFSPKDESFVIERPDLCLTAQDGTKMAPTKLQDEVAPFTLLTSTSGEERLKVHMFYDKSVLEVFVNERAAITTRVYLLDTGCSSVEFFAEAGDGDVLLEEAIVWDGLSQ